MKITSRDNSLLQRARAVRDGKIRDSIFIEGLRLCEEAFASDLSIEAAIYSEELARKERAAGFIEKLVKSATKSASVSEKLLASISYTKAPQGIVVLATRPPSDETSFTANEPASLLLVVLHEISNPVNVGAVMRTAEAAGVTGVIATANTADPFSPKALRGAMGSAFRIPIWSGPTFIEAIDWCRSHQIQIIGAAADGAKLYTEVNWRDSSALIVGRESTGLSADEIKVMNNVVRIPMQGEAESLNVAVATGIILYEAARQRAQK